MNFIATLRERISLSVKGYAKGVSVAYLSKSQAGIAKDLNDWVENHSDAPARLAEHFKDAQKVYLDTINEENVKVASPSWNAEENLCILLFSLIRTNKPKIVVETGVANGVTTRVMMSALSEYGGELHSFDILAASSKVYSGNGKWKFHLLSRAGTAKDFINQMSDLPEVDLWVHDSNHGSTWQEFEYRLAVSKLSRNGFLVSDDIDASPAWAKVSNDVLESPWAIFDSRKIIGIAAKNVI